MYADSSKHEINWYFIEAKEKQRHNVGNHGGESEAVQLYLHISAYLVKNTFDSQV